MHTCTDRQPKHMIPPAPVSQRWRYKKVELENAEMTTHPFTLNLLFLNVKPTVLEQIYYTRRLYNCCYL